MNLLLLLSALLSALTGMTPSVRRADVALAVAQPVPALQSVRKSIVIAAMRPIEALPTLIVAARPSLARVGSGLMMTVPLYLSKLRQ